VIFSRLINVFYNFAELNLKKLKQNKMKKVTFALLTVGIAFLASCGGNHEDAEKMKADSIAKADSINAALAADSAAAAQAATATADSLTAAAKADSAAAVAAATKK